jgi:hypothetical protein
MSGERKRSRAVPDFRALPFVVERPPYYPNRSDGLTWIMKYNASMDPRGIPGGYITLKAKTADEAKTESIQIYKTWLTQVIGEFDD